MYYKCRKKKKKIFDSAWSSPVWTGFQLSTSLTMCSSARFGSWAASKICWLNFYTEVRDSNSPHWQKSANLSDSQCGTQRDKMRAVTVWSGHLPECAMIKLDNLAEKDRKLRTLLSNQGQWGCNPLPGTSLGLLPRLGAGPWWAGGSPLKALILTKYFRQ